MSTRKRVTKTAIASVYKDYPADERYAQLMSATGCSFGVCTRAIGKAMEEGFLCNIQGLPGRKDAVLTSKGTQLLLRYGGKK